MDGSILTIGTFTQPATAVNQIIAIPSAADYVNVFNYTQFAAGPTNGTAVQFYWQRGMGTNGVYFGANATPVAIYGATAANAFTIYDPSNTTLGALVAITNINAGTGVVQTGNTAGLAVGSVIRLSGLSAASAQQYGGIDFSVTAVVVNTSFTIVPLTPSAAIGACTGFYTIVPTGLFYPRKRIISNITQAAGGAVVTTTVNHGYSVGNQVRFVVPAVTATQFGMTQIDSLSGTIIAVGSATAFTVNIDSSAFGTFAWPAAASVPFSPAIVELIGDNTSVALAQVPALSSLEDAVQNTGYYGLILATGALLPGGVANDVIYWNAGKATMGGL